MSESTQPTIVQQAQDAASKLASTVAETLNISGKADVDANESGEF